MPQFYTLKIKFNDKENNPLYTAGHLVPADFQLFII